MKLEVTKIADEFKVMRTEVTTLNTSVSTVDQKLDEVLVSLRTGKAPPPSPPSASAIVPPASGIVPPGGLVPPAGGGVVIPPYERVLTETPNEALKYELETHYGADSPRELPITLTQSQCNRALEVCGIRSDTPIDWKHSFALGPAPTYDAFNRIIAQRSLAQWLPKLRTADIPEDVISQLAVRRDLLLAFCFIFNRNADGVRTATL